MGYPILLDVTGRCALIVGGGVVAVRKAAGLLAAGVARVRCVAPRISADMPANVERLAESFAARHLDGVHIVFAATDSPQVNGQVVAEARARGLWVNRADTEDELPGDFAVPAVHRDGPLTIAVSAGSPALAAVLRNHLAESLDPAWAQLAELMQTLRPLILQRVVDEDRRRQLLRALASPEAMASVREGGEQALRRWLADRFPDAVA